MKTPLFNSLGSNYFPEFIRTASASAWHPFTDATKQVNTLEQTLGDRFNGVAIAVYKGRDAIELALRAMLELGKKSKDEKQIGVITQGLACHAIEEGIQRAGCVPVYVDLHPGTLGPSVATIEEGLRWAKANDIEVRAVFLQHTLGYANPVSEIRRLCDRYGLVLIEDLAQSFGAQDREGKELGSMADIVICSFGRDKVLDAVSGGAVIIKHGFFGAHTRELTAWKTTNYPRLSPPRSAVIKEMSYPKLTSVIRATHASGVGKILFKVAKALHLLTSPISSPTSIPTYLPAAYAGLVLLQYQRLQTQLKHRRAVAAVYFEELSSVEGIEVLANPDQLDHDIHLRVPVLFSDPETMSSVIIACRKVGVFLSDRWYRAVVDSGSLNYQSVYRKGSRPTAEYTAQRLLNLPTHQYTSLEHARTISRIIKEQLHNYV